jgi:hypothetical protein
MEEESGYPPAKDMEEILKNRMSGERKCLEVYIDNQRTTLEDALKRCVQERTVYMPDYVLDENGVLEQLRFDKIDLL